ncbi:MAG: SBBP repeat-containing protein, partial [Flavobacteriales bacterium]
MRPRTVTQRIAGGILFALGMPALLFAQNENVEEKGWFMPDRGQFHDKVRFRSSLPGGKFYIEEKGFSYLQVDGEKIAELHHRVRGDKDPPLSEFSVDAHSVKVDLMGAATPSFEKEGRSGYYANFYRGKDPSEHAEKVHTYEEVILSGIYEGVALRFERKPHGIKYSFECDPHAKIANIRMRYQGQEKLEITEDGGLRIHTSLGDIREKAPKAYQWIDGRKKAIPCRFTVQDSAVGFRFPKGYEEDRPLIIDPNVIFSTYTGSTSDNWGNTATYDSDGALYAGGTVFGSGYPTTTGAYQLNFGGGSGGLGCDVSISKFAPDGTSLIYSTYLGGSANELPHSLVVDQMGRLYVLGSTGSSDFPTDSTAALPTFMGGNNGSAFGAIPFNNGTDAFVSKFSANGSTLLGSTYLGGTSNDGLNEAGSLNYNYGDILRGEVEVDGSGNAYVVSTTRSPDLPVTGSVFQDSLAGIQDAFVTKLNPDLSGILFCGYYGGDSTDAGYAIERNPGFGIYISGGTTSDNIPAPQGWQTSLQGGVDGFVARMDASASSVLNASYVGTSSYDQSYFVGRDSSDNILLYGQSTGTYPVVNASYSDPNSGQFIQMLPPDLNSSILSTVFGTGSGSVDISPSAFMVSECNNIYLSGWGGNVNQAHGVNSSSTSGLPITGNAYQSNTDGSDFYLMVLGDSASSLKYGSFFGGGVSDEHVDGGTSRFDDEGVVYQAVCGGCGGNSDFPTTPGAHSSQNNSSNCNLAAFKFDMSQL